MQALTTTAKLSKPLSGSPPPGCSVMYHSRCWWNHPEATLACHVCPL